MKGITRCEECSYYNYNTGKCRNGAEEAGGFDAPFYVDCPLPEAEEVVRYTPDGMR